MKPLTIRGPAHQTNEYCYTAHRQVECILLCSSGQVRSHLIGCDINIKPSTSVWHSGMKRTISPLSKMYNSRRFDVYLIALIIYLGFATVAHAQDKPPDNEPKNKLEVIFSPTISKTDFQNFLEYSDATFERMYESQKPKSPIITHYYGINYKRTITKNFSLSIGFNYAKNGQRSPVFFSVKGIPDEDLLAREGYGGQFYRIMYDSYEVPLNVGYRWHSTKRFHYYLTGGIIGNIYERVRIEKYTVNRLTGKMRTSLQQTFMDYSSKGFLKDISARIDRGLWRIGFIAGARAEYRLAPHFFIACQPVFRYYGKLHKEYSTAAVASGSIINFGLNIGAGAAF